jgi:uncharacterized protein YbbK (DUF523 family)/uncharacterized protein YbgA (DUF1722 family)
VNQNPASIPDIRLGISACLLGEPVRYDGGHKLDHFLRDTLSRFVTWIPICPEAGCGLPIPREAMRLVNREGRTRLSTIRTLQDHTERVETWAEGVLNELGTVEFSGYIFKNRSPSCGPCHVRVFKSGVGAPSKSGVGVFSRMFQRRFPDLPVEVEDSMHNLELRESFIERVCVWTRWRDYLTKGSGEGLLSFHTRHELLVMAHSPGLVRQLGDLAASAETDDAHSAHQSYIALLMRALKPPSTRFRQANVFKKAAGHFGKMLDETERMELNHVIEQFRLGCIPFEMPANLIMRFARQFHETRIENQVYFNPHPVEYMLRTHL